MMLPFGLDFGGLGGFFFVTEPRQVFPLFMFLTFATWAAIAAQTSGKAAPPEDDASMLPGDSLLLVESMAILGQFVSLAAASFK